MAASIQLQTSARKTKTSAKAAESVAELARSPSEQAASPTELDIAFTKEGSTFQKDMAGMKEVLKSNNYLSGAFSETLTLDEKFSLVISEMYRLKKAQEVSDRKYKALEERFKTHEDAIRQNQQGQEEAFDELEQKVQKTSDEIVEIHTENQGTTSQIEDLQVQSEQTGRDIALLKGFSDKFEKQFEVLKAKNTAASVRAMEKNIIISGIPEKKKENCILQVANFLNNKLRIRFEQSQIKTAFRQGPYNPTRTRGMIVKLSRSLKQKALAAKETLKQLERNTGEIFYINEQIPEALLAERKALQYEIKRIKEYNEGQKNEQAKLDFYVKNKQLYVENEPHTQYVYPPKPTELFVSAQEQTKIDEMLIGMSQPKTKGGSVFVGVAIPTLTLEDVNRAYRKVRQMYPSYDHIMMAYRIQDYSGYQDDGEHTAGVKLHALLCEAKKRHIALFVARNFGGTNLGPIRFKYIVEVAKQAIEKLLEIAEYVPAPVLPTRQTSPSLSLSSSTPTPFPETTPPQEQWPAENSTQWNNLTNPAGSGSVTDDNFDTPDESQQSSGESSSEEENQEDTIIDKTL